MIPAVYAWPTNADLTADVAVLHPLGDLVLDATYGRGRWWMKHRPAQLVTNDADPTSKAEHHADFQNLPWPDNHFDGVAFDPPYKFNGTPALGDFDHAYGLTEATPWQERLHVMENGLVECLRVTKHGGFVYAKCQDQVVSGAVRWQTVALTRAATDVGATLVDRFDMLGGTRPQPEGRRQVHARGRGSSLLVFRAALPGGTE